MEAYTVMSRPSSPGTAANELGSMRHRGHPLVHVAAPDDDVGIGEEVGVVAGR